MLNKRWFCSECHEEWPILCSLRVRCPLCLDPYSMAVAFPNNMPITRHEIKDFAASLAKPPRYHVYEGGQPNEVT